MKGVPWLDTHGISRFLRLVRPGTVFEKSGLALMEVCLVASVASHRVDRFANPLILLGLFDPDLR